MSWRPAALGTAGALAIAAVFGVIAVHALVDPERMKQIARDKAQQAWGRELAMTSIELDFLPRPALHARGVSLANPPWAKSGHLIESDDVVGELALLPLLVGKVRVKALALQGVVVRLETSAQGEESWVLSPDKSKSPGTSTPATDLPDLVEFRLRDASIFRGTSARWRIDEATIQCSPGLRDLRLDASGSQDHHPLKVKARFDDLAHAGVPGATSTGHADFDWGQTQLAIDGRFPLDGTLTGHALRADLKSSRLNDMLAFFDIARRPTAPVEAHVASSESGGAIEAKDIRIKLGRFELTGEAKALPASPISTFDAHFAGTHLDWPQALLDAGDEPLPPRAPDELFYSRPLAWGMLVAMKGWRGNVDAVFTSVRMRSGIELQGLRTRSSFEDDRWKVNSYTTGMLGGTASGTLEMEGRRQFAKLTLEGSGLLLERFFKERSSVVPFKAGPMKVSASVSATGASIRDLAQAISGPITIRMGPGVLNDPKAGAANTKMTGTGTPEAGIAFECASANLPFKDGRASRSPLFAAESDQSYLVTSGAVDFRTETYDLHGRIKPRSSGKVSLSTFMGDIMITGKIRHPHMTHDASKTPAEIGRAGLAVVTLGASALASTANDAAKAEEKNPCEAVF
jgi:AsmA family protein